MMISQVFFALIVAPVARTLAGQCTLCDSGVQSDPLFAEKPIGLTVPVSIPTCASLEDIMNVLPEEHALCEAAKTMSAYCGCPIDEDSCRLCPPSRPKMTNRDLQLDIPMELLPEGTELFGIQPTCDIVESGLVTLNRTNPLCTQVPEELQTLCGCVEEAPPLVDEQHCSFCSGGEDLPFLPTKFIHFQDPTSDAVSCETLFDLALETAPNGTLCTAIQEHTYGCGCPEKKENPCRVCEGAMVNGDAMLVVDGLVTNCQNLESKLRTISASDDKCVVTSDIIEMCGCVDDLPGDRCTICPGGEPVGFPDKDVTYIIQDLDDSFLPNGSPTYTCAIVEASLQFDPKDSPACRSTQILAKTCGCPVRENSCNICGKSGTMMKPNAKFVAAYNDAIESYEPLDSVFLTGPTFDAAFSNKELSCEIVDSAYNALFDADDERCYVIQYFNSAACGCDPPNKVAITMVWVQRCFATVSMLGSILIILYIMLWDKKKRFTTYNQVLLGISSFDFISSLALALGSLPAPDNLGLDGAHGNTHTCRLQGFMYQLGLTSLYYNVALSSYYLLVIKYSWTERKFQKIGKFLHVGMLLVGFGMAFGSIPFHEGHTRFCYVTRPPVEDSYVPAIMFFVTPVSLSILAITTLTVMMVWFVLQQERKTMKRSMTKSKASLTRQAFWQSLMFLLAFYLVWPLSFVIYFLFVRPENVWLYMVASVLGPSQGLFNALVFFNRKRTALSKMFEKWKCGRCCKKRKNQENTLDNTSGRGMDSTSRTDHFRRGSLMRLVSRRVNERSASAFFSRSQFFTAKSKPMVPQDSPAAPVNVPPNNTPKAEEPSMTTNAAALATADEDDMSSGQAGIPDDDPVVTWGSKSYDLAGCSFDLEEQNGDDGSKSYDLTGCSFDLEEQKCEDGTEEIGEARDLTIYDLVAPNEPVVEAIDTSRDMWASWPAPAKRSKLIKQRSVGRRKSTVARRKLSQRISFALFGLDETDLGELDFSSDEDE